MIDSFIRKLKTKFLLPLPGTKAQFGMAPSFRLTMSHTTVKAKAGVLLFLYPNGDDWKIIFMKRPEYSGTHSGQISFPGGKFDAADSTMESTALRETEEEIGVPAEKIKILGQLTKLYIPVSEFEVFPFVGYAETKPVFRIDSHEVQYLIEANIHDLLDPTLKGERPYKVDNISGLVPFFKVENHEIWGATAMILNEFLTLIRD